MVLSCFCFVSLIWTRSTPSGMLDVGGSDGVTGMLPPAWGNLKQLELLSIWGLNRLSAQTIPMEYWGLTNLTNLLLTRMALTGTLSSMVGNLLNLEYLMIRRTRLAGDIPTQVGNLTGLVELVLSHNALDGTIPSELGECVGLRLLELHVNQLHGTIPNALGQLTSMQKMILRDNGLSGTVPPGVCSLLSDGGLSRFQVDYCDVTQQSGCLQPCPQ
mmetsp:Transcript_10499/g.24337  ORF Transcript_10499/g.24337 Transcript_10499/m.24337 type:complete len:216 (+) Transcript_10499:1575-2222(+)